MQAQQDELTGLLTMAGFVQELDQALRTRGDWVLAVLDLDHFLSFNEKYGHVCGDEWLKGISARFADAFAGERSIMGRYGGDEFMAALPASDMIEIYNRAEQLRLSVEQDAPVFQHEGQEVRPNYTISVGLAAYPSNARDANDLIDKGKQALVRAKIAGGNQVCFFQEADTLTGLPNAYASQRTLEEALAAAAKNCESVSVFLIDIDRFKEINDEYGHRVGDEVLRKLAHILENNFKEIGATGRMGGKELTTLARVAGDEFMVIMPGHRADTAFVLAEEVRRLVEDSEVRYSAGNNEGALHFTISGGIATYPSDAAERVDLLRKADEALYRSKTLGRNRISLPASAQMVTKTSYYSQVQLERLAGLARRMEKTEAYLLREALDELLRKYGDSGD